ncbi:hypothetical protein F4808DRAFT_314652 [Astrocystis sublimbata]|nr:hypothetical protein F4808DRAFT_314652 [Astrocystis sublimbata]
MFASPNLPFVIGNDICHIARIRRILKGRLAPQFVRRILRAEEIEQSNTARILRCILDPKGDAGSTRNAPNREVVAKAQHTSTRDDAPNFIRAVEFMAGRFAAKEAVIKAHPYRRLTFQCIAIVRQRLEPPTAHQTENTRRSTTEPDEEEVSDKAATPMGQGGGPLVALIKAAEERREGEGQGPYGDDTYATVSISHDTEYATAVCLGINPASRIFGSGQPSSA